jgi:hypothetical protein
MIIAASQLKVLISAECDLSMPVCAWNFISIRFDKKTHVPALSVESHIICQYTFAEAVSTNQSKVLHQ